MALVTLVRVDDSAEKTFEAGVNGFLPAAAINAWAAGSEVRVTAIINNGNGADLPAAVQATLADMPPLDLTSSPLRIEFKAGTDLVATITNALTDVPIVVCDETGVWDYRADVAAGAHTVQSAMGFQEKAILASDTPEADIQAVKANMVAAWGTTDTGVPYTEASQVTDVNLTVTLTNGGFYTVVWGDGAASIDVASGAEATHTYAGAFNGTVTIRFPAASGPIDTITSTAGRWSFASPFNGLAGPFPVAALPFEETASIEGAGESANTIVPTFTRASTATVVDDLGYVIATKSGEARFQGARRVENVLPSETPLINTAASLTGLGDGVYRVVTDPLINSSRIRFGALEGGIDNQIYISSAMVFVESATAGAILRLGILGNTFKVYSCDDITGQWIKIEVAGQRAGFEYRFFDIGHVLVGEEITFLVKEPMLEKAFSMSDVASDYVSLSAYYGANVPGVRYDPKPGCGLLIEPAATNTVPNSEDVSAWSTPGDAVLEATETGPTGATGAVYSLAAAGAAAVHNNIGAVTVGSIRPFSIFVKDDGSGAVSFKGANGTMGETGVTFTIATEAFSAAGSLVVDYGFEALADDWYRLWVRSDHAAAANAGIEIDVTAGSVLLFGAQYENRPVMTSYIPTAGAAVTRAEDAIFYSNVDVNGPCSIAWHGQMQGPTTSSDLRLFSGDDSRGAMATLRVSGAGEYAINQSNAEGVLITLVSSEVGITPYSASVRVAQSGENGGIWATGVNKVLAVAAEEPDHSNAGIWRLHQFSGAKCYGTVRNFQIFGEALSDEQMAWLSTLGNTPWVEYLETAAEAATGAPSDEGAWATATPYAVDAVVSRGGRSFICTTGHTSASTTEPAAGADWRTVWQEVQ